MKRSPSTQRYWRSLKELEGTEEFQELLAAEFPAGPEEDWTETSRRRFLQVMGASLALGAAASCRFSEERLVPKASRDADEVPGKPTFFSSAFELGGFAQPVVLTCYEGRPVKVEGNPDHPDSLGATSIFAQAAVLDLYDPDRSREPVRYDGGVERLLGYEGWKQWEAWAGPHFDALAAKGGEGLVVWAPVSRSRVLARQREEFRRRFPKARWLAWDATVSTAERDGCRMAFGEPLRPRYRLDKARVVLTLADDLLDGRPDSLRLAREFAAHRRPEEGWVSRLYAVEGGFSVTGGNADHRLPLRNEQIEAFLAVLEAKLVAGGLEHPQPVEVEDAEPALHAAGLEEFVDALAGDLLRHPGQCVVTVGPQLPAAVHARAQRLNVLLGAVGETVDYLPESRELRADDESLLAFAREAAAGKVDTLVVLGGNPAYDTPGELGFAELMGAIANKVHLGAYRDETALLSDWHLPIAHPFESWTDGQAADGSHVIGQPAIDPIWAGRTVSEIVSVMLGEKKSAMELVREATGLGETAWRKAVQDGFVAGSAPRPVKVQAGRLAPPKFEPELLAEERDNGELEVAFRLGTVLDGRFANNGWLQELPDPITKLTWDNAAVMGFATAEALGVTDFEKIRLSLGGGSVELPVLRVPGVARGVVQVELGYGRTAAGHVAGLNDDAVEPVGVDVNPLRSLASPWFVVGGEVTRLGGHYPLATTQDHHAIDAVGYAEREGRVPELVREATVQEYHENPLFAKRAPDGWGPEASIFEELPLEGEYRWGMAIDLSVCTGCSACTIACQAENNIPVVGKEQVLKGREMHWIRMDRYFTGDLENPRAAHQPLTCQQCELAPCESVCPVAATVHSSEGLNDMVYNRCIGTRYCSNNCPYKVRRFNYLNFRKDLWKKGNEILRMVNNPEVTVRSRGVMEKCTFCVQRIQAARRDAAVEQRNIREGEVQTACQQVCPTGAIVFGDLNDSESAVSKAHANTRAYRLLGELNDKPRNRFLARIRNPHPALLALEEAARGQEAVHHG